TVLAALVENEVFPDPYFGLNLKDIPGYKDGLWHVMAQDSQEERWASFGWNVLSIPGNDMEAIDAAITLAKRYKGKPSVIVLNTTKGCGVSFMENRAEWHHKVPNDAQLAQALEELAERSAALQ
ncbi:MAG: hypothetical protein EOM63_08055, partial [Clostridia bacterium]|nr:hypothetical protein [Clostridia bacterium]